MLEGCPISTHTDYEGHRRSRGRSSRSPVEVERAGPDLMYNGPSTFRSPLSHKYLHKALCICCTALCCVRSISMSVGADWPSRRGEHT